MILRRYKSSLLAILALILLLGYYWYKQPLILSPFGFRLLANQGTTLALAALAQLTVVLTGGVDLSVGAIVGLANAIAATYMGDSPFSVVTVVLLTLGAGAGAGLINGVLVAYGRIQPIIVTLATLYIYSGFALLIRPQPGGSVPSYYATTLTGSWGYLPYSLIVLLVVTLLFRLPIMRSRLGTAIYAVGDNPGGAHMSGIKVNRTLVSAYVIGGVLAACAGLFLTAQTTSGDATIGTAYTLNSVAAVVFGGAILGGGRGLALGPIIAAFFISIIISVLFAAGVSSFYQSVFQGGILIFVLMFGNAWTLRVRNRLSVLRS
ncbi:ABC transporter permease [Jiella sp. MQZ9-1]|uniref:ABC transporter permease n=1 Tax=Jiella flava TaxID=2816857 RepID=A0A939FZB9_9HYPH|nr:ABC transporter permease [Jiella flava]MBO0662980.1 ABC transporter permease [Jiella flava]MCD2471260.1 ABC transporter permease [Jiella flava]